MTKKYIDPIDIIAEAIDGGSGRSKTTAVKILTSLRRQNYHVVQYTDALYIGYRITKEKAVTWLKSKI